MSASDSGYPEGLNGMPAEAEIDPVSIGAGIFHYRLPLPGPEGVKKRAIMLKEKKVEIVSNLADNLSRSSIIIATNYQGLLAKQMADLRNALTKAGIGYHVVKNSLVYRAADQASRPHLKDIVEGPVALAFGYDDAINTAKSLHQYIKSTGLALQIKGGLLEDRVLLPEELTSLANLPSREVLISRLLGQLQAPISALHNMLSYPMRGVLTVLQNRAQTASK
jgi:large subunit ribosomal protein L10